MCYKWGSRSYTEGLEFEMQLDGLRLVVSPSCFSSSMMR